MVCILPVKETSAKSAKLASALTIAAQLPSLSKSETLNSLNHNSILFGKSALFFTPNIKVRILERFGLPFILIRNSVSSPGIGTGNNSFTAAPWSRRSSFKCPKFSMLALMLFNSGHISSAICAPKAVILRGISI